MHITDREALFRLVGIFTLLFLETGLIAFFHEPVNSSSSLLYQLNKTVFYGKLQPLALLFCTIFPVFLWAWRSTMLPAWKECVTGHPWKLLLVVNLVIFIFMVSLTIYLGSFPGGKGSSDHVIEILWHFGLACIPATLLISAAPVRFWLNFFRKFLPGAVLSLIASIFIIVVAFYSQSTWNNLSEATFHLSYAILGLYETEIFKDPVARKLGVGQFLIIIDPQCSGYEGVGLVTAFLTVYIFAFRHSLRFPNIFVLYLIGIPLIWVLNAARIAMLASIGGHLSPEIAVTGFHSQAGWIMFLLVTIGLMVASYQFSFFRRDLAVEHIDSKPDDGFRLAVALLAPFIAFMIASIISSVLSEHADAEWFYLLKVVLISCALWWYRSVYLRYMEKVSPVSILLGLGLGILWIATDTNSERQSILGSWISGLPAWAFALWVSMRLFGAVILIPLAEEFAFRGYLYRALISRRFETVNFSTLKWFALLISSLLFGIMHLNMFIEAFIAGMLFTYAMIRTNRLSDAVAAHMSANLLIGIWAVSANQWSLL